MKIGVNKSAQATKETSQLFTKAISDYELEKEQNALSAQDFQDYVLRNSKIPYPVLATLI